MWCSIRSRSNRRCSRSQAPVSRAVTMLSRPRMCDGGVATWMRSRDVSCSASRQCRTAARNDAWVCRTAFGSPVVPELNTSTASAAGVGRRRSRLLPGRSARRGAASASDRPAPGGRRRACGGLVTASAWSTSSRFQAGLSSTTAAPSRQIACTAATNSGRLPAISATRSPARHTAVGQCGRQPAGQRVEKRQAVAPLLEHERGGAGHRPPPTN